MKVTFLGTGTSHGVPSLDCMRSDFTNCPKGVCKASQHDPKHRRTRSSVLVEYNKKSVLIDVSADFRDQALREKVKKIDAVLITHAHADHTGGIPDIRSYTIEAPLPFFGSAETIDSIKKSFSYIFDSSTFIGGGIPRITTFIIDKSFSLFDQTVTPIHVSHGNLKGALGYRIGPLGYVPDLNKISDEELVKLEGIDTLILNCLRTTPLHSTHLTLAESICLAKKVAPRQCYFIHMSHDIHYQIDAIGLESWMKFSYDGLTIEI